MEKLKELYEIGLEKFKKDSKIGFEKLNAIDETVKKQ